MPESTVSPAMSQRLFVQGAHEHVEICSQFTYTPTTSNQVIQPIDIPAYGYLRSVKLEFINTRAADGSPVLAADAPWSMIKSIALQDVNGGNIIWPMDGFALLQANIQAAYSFRQDPRDGVVYSNRATAPQFSIRLPLEIWNATGLGSLANQDSSANYKLQLTLGTRGDIWSSLPSSDFGQWQVRVWLEAWTIPSATDMFGNPQIQAPPALGTARYMSYNIQDVVIGSNTIPIKRVGNMIMALIFICRDVRGARSDLVFPSDFTLSWDGRDMYQAVSQTYIAELMQESIVSSQPRDAGVFALQFTKDTLNRAGNGPLNQLYPTVESTRLEVRGTAAAAGTMQIVTLDLAPAQVNPAGRYVLDSNTGIHPSGTSQPIPGA